MRKRAGRMIAFALLAVAASVGLYAAYVFRAWYRVEDRQTLEIQTIHDYGMGAALKTGETHRIASYNIGFGAYSADYSFFMDGGKESRARSKEAVVENVAGAIHAAASLDPDFLLLQEVDVDGTRSFHVDQWALVCSQMYFLHGTFAQNYDSPYLFWPLLEPHGANRAGIAVFSKYPIAAAVRRQLPIESGVMKLVDLDRCYSVQRIPVPGEGRELVLYALHLSAYTSDGKIAEEQLRMLFADMLAEYEKGNWTIAGGDFNKDLLGNSGEIFGVSGPEYTWAQPIPAEMIPDGLTIAAPFDAASPTPSCRNSDRPYGPDTFCVTVDGFIVSGNVDVLDAKVLDTGFQWSDHNPVFMDFVLY